MRRLVKIAGAGPAGLTAAINLAHAGFNVEVHEMKKSAGERFKNCFQILENYTEKEDVLVSIKRMNIKPNFFCQPTDEIEFFDSKLNRFLMKSKEVYCYFIKRGTDNDTLDQGLAKQAVDAGVKIIYSDKQELQNADIIATGAKDVAGISKEVVFDTDIENTYRVIFDDNITPKGFSYLFVMNKKGTVGSAIVKKFSQINQFTERAVSRFQEIEKFKIDNIQEVVSFVDFYLPKSANDNNRLVIGEAGGFQDYLFGIGIRRSITSGFLAAKSIIDSTDYDTLWKPQLSEKLKTGIVNRFLFELGGNFGYTMFNRSAQKHDFREYGYRITQPSTFKKIIFPLVKTIWKKPDKCLHGDNCLWCRKNK